MMSGLLIRGGTIVNEGESYRGWIVVEGAVSYTHLTLPTNREG